jgi:flagellar biosynthesis/type III secretory pathway protein FliH
MKTAQEWYQEMQHEASLGIPATPMLERIAAIQKDALTELVAATLLEENDILRAQVDKAYKAGYEHGVAAATSDGGQAGHADKRHMQQMKRAGTRQPPHTT